MQRKWTEAKVASLIAKGVGAGSGPDYQPWIHVRDISSQGRKHLVPGTRFGRDVHLLSNIEYGLFLVLEWSDAVLDINEQFALDRDLTQDVARKLGVKHPYYPGTNVPTVMTSDFLVTLRRGGQTVVEAFNAKSDSDAEDIRQMEKLEIQRTALELMDVKHHLVFDSSLPQKKVRNLDLLERARVKPNEIEPNPGYFDEMARRLARHATHAVTATPNQTLSQVCAEFDNAHGAPEGTGLRAAYILAKRKELTFDLDSEHPAQQLIGGFTFKTDKQLKRVAGGAR